MQEIINSKEISVIVQGPIHCKKTKKCLKSIRKHLPDAEIILSTWEGCNVDNMDYDYVIFNKDPRGVQQKKYIHRKLFSNINRMIISTNEGVKKANRKYILKIRTDALIHNTNFLKIFNKFDMRADEYKLFDRRILASSLLTRVAFLRNKERIEIPFHISDWWFFGLANDIKKFLLAAEIVEEPYFSNYFEYPDNKRKKSVYDKFDWKFAPEQYLGYSCFSKYFGDIKMEDCSDCSDSINNKSKKCLVNNFVFLDFKQSGISNQKYKYSKNELFCGEQYLDLYTFYVFEKEYKKYCDTYYKITASNFLFKNKKSSYKILRFFKHLYRLFDNETSFSKKLEELFIGIPYSFILFVINRT